MARLVSGNRAPPKKPSKLALALGKNVRARREEMGLTQAELAQRLSMTQRAISDIELGRGNPQLTTVESICMGIGLTVAELLVDASRIKKS